MSDERPTPIRDLAARRVRRASDRRFVIIRAVNVVLLSTAAVALGELGDRRIAAAAALVGLHLPLLALIETRAPTRNRTSLHLTLDAAACVGFALVAPASFHAVAIVFVTLVMVSRLIVGARSTAVAAAGGAVGFALIGFTNEVPSWIPVVAAIFIVLPSAEVYFRARSRWDRAESDHLSSMVARVPALFWELDAETLRIENVSGRTKELLGCEPSDVIGKSVAVLGVPGSDRLVRGLAVVGSDEISDRGRLRHQVTGDAVWFRHTFRRVRTTDGPRLTGVSFEITELVETQRSLERYHQVVERSRDALLIVEYRSGRFVVDNANPAAAPALMVDAITRGADLRDVFDWIEPVGVVEELACAHHQQHARSMQEVVVVAGDPVIRSIFDISISPLDDARTSIRFEDVTERVEAAEVIRFQADHDSLTGLTSRMSFLQQVDAELGDDGAGPTTIAILDLDRFKPVNDTLGHDVGDELLRTVAARVRAEIRSTDVVARLGGDEFALLLRGCDAVTASHLARRIRAGVSAPFRVGELRVAIDVSIGLATTFDDRDTTTTKTLMRRADVAMYRAKATGDGIEHYRPEFETNSTERLQLAAELAEGLERGELVLHFQPVVSTATGEVVGLEGLARWQHPELGTLSPDRFIDVVLLSPHRRAFTRMVANSAATAAATLRATRSGAWVSLNLDVRDLLDDQLTDDLIAAVTAAAAGPDALVLEVTEGDLADHLDEAVRSLSRARDLGFRTAIDDFGTGHSSLARLQELPIDVLKLDQAFLRGAHADPHRILSPIIELAHRLEFTCVAEGVETSDHLLLLRELGCDRAQGYLVSRPVPLDHALASIGEIEQRLSATFGLHH